MVSSPSVKSHILQILSLTISFHLASHFHSPCHIHTIPGSSGIPATEMGSSVYDPFKIHPGSMIVFSKPKLTYFKKQKLDIF